MQFDLLRKKQEKERKALVRDLSHARSMEQARADQKREKTRRSASKVPQMPRSELEFEGFDLDIDTDLEPEI